MSLPESKSLNLVDSKILNLIDLKLLDLIDAESEYAILLEKYLAILRLVDVVVSHYFFNNWLKSDRPRKTNPIYNLGMEFANQALTIINDNKNMSVLTTMIKTLVDDLDFQIHGNYCPINVGQNIGKITIHCHKELKSMTCYKYMYMPKSVSYYRVVKICVGKPQCDNCEILDFLVSLIASKIDHQVIVGLESKVLLSGSEFFQSDIHGNQSVAAQIVEALRDGSGGIHGLKYSIKNQMVRFNIDNKLVGVQSEPEANCYAKSTPEANCYVRSKL